jgi:ABC-type lipoprotein release transport system permease subunit
MLIAAVATLGVGIGLNTTIFALMFPASRGLSQQGLVHARRIDAAGRKIPPLPSDANQLATRGELFSDAFAQARWETRVGDAPVRGLIVSENYFSAFGITPALNPTPPAGQPPEIVMSRRASLSLFRWPFPPVGRVIDLAGCKVRIAGVVPESFSGADVAPSDFWIFKPAAERCGAMQPFDTVIARLRPGVASLDPIPADDGGQFLLEEVQGIVRLPGMRKEAVSPLLLAFLLTLTIPCINVANLMLARSLAKQRELGIRLALGASRRQAAQLLLADGLKIGLLSALVAFPIAWAGIRIAEALLFLGATVPAAAGLRTHFPIPRLDPAAFFACLASGIVAAVLFSTGPALRAAAQPVCESLRGEIAGLRVSRLLKTMVLGQMSFCALILALSAALLWNVRELDRVSPGYRTQGVVEVTAAADPVTAKRTLESQPWIASAALTSATFNMGVNGVDALSSVVSAAYFDTLGIPLRSGRDFSPAEARGSANVAIVSAATARAWWPHRDPIGQSFDLDPFDLRFVGLPTDGRKRTLRVVGVAADVITARLWEDVDRYRIYLPGETSETQHLLVRLADPAAPDGLNRVAAVFGHEQVFVEPLEHTVAGYRFMARMVALISLALGILMLILAWSGMTSMLALTTELRTKEFAIRSAIGASPRSLFGLVTGSASRLACAGALVGLGLFCALDVFLLPQLQFPLRGTRWIVYGAVPLVMLTIGLLSALAPGLRASRSHVADLMRRSAE